MISEYTKREDSRFCENRTQVKEAFAMWIFDTYSIWEQMSWAEPVYIYANRIRRLIEMKAKVLEWTMELAFVTGFPDHISINWCLESTIGDLITTAKVLMISKEHKIGAAVIAEQNSMEQCICYTLQVLERNQN